MTDVIQGTLNILAILPLFSPFDILRKRKVFQLLTKKKKNDSNGEKCYVNNSVQNKENGTLEKEGKRKPEQQKRERHRQNGNKNRVIKKDLVNSTPEPFT